MVLAGAPSATKSRSHASSALLRTSQLCPAAAACLASGVPVPPDVMASSRAATQSSAPRANRITLSSGRSIGSSMVTIGQPDARYSCSFNGYATFVHEVSVAKNDGASPWPEAFPTSTMCGWTVPRSHTVQAPVEHTIGQRWPSARQQVLPIHPLPVPIVGGERNYPCIAAVGNMELAVARASAATIRAWVGSSR